MEQGTYEIELWNFGLSKTKSIDIAFAKETHSNNKNEFD